MSTLWLARASAVAQRSVAAILDNVETSTAALARNGPALEAALADTRVALARAGEAASAVGKLADATTVVPLQYTLLLWAIIFGWIFFGDTPRTVMLVGAVSSLECPSLKVPVMVLPCLLVELAT